MTTLSDLKEMKEALDVGLVSQADYDNVKRDYLRAQKEALVEFQKRELLAKEEFQKRKAEADLRAYALESIVKHGSSLMSEEQKVDLVRDYIRMSGLDPATTEKAGPSSKRQRIKAEPRDASPPQTAKPASTSAATNQAPGAPAPGTSTSGGGVLNEHILQILNMSGLDRGATERDASPPQPQPSTPPAPAAVPSYADAPIPADEDEYSNCSADAPRDDSDCVEPTTTKRREWTKDDDAALVSALRAGQKVSTIEIGGRSGGAASKRLSRAREDGTGSPALREYLKEYMCNSSHQQKTNGWSAEEEETFIRAHKEGKLLKEIAAMLPGRTKSALRTRWYEAKIGKAGTAALKAYAAECATAKGSSWSVEEEQTTIRAHKKGKTFQEIAAMLPGRTEIAVGARWSLAKSGRYGSAALREYAAECTPEKSPWSVEEDHTFIKAHKEGKTMKETAAMLPGRTECAVQQKWHKAKNGTHGTAALIAYAAECTPSENPSSWSWSVEEDQTLIRAHKEGKTPLEIAPLLPGRTNTAVSTRWQLAKNGTRGSAALRAYAAEYCLQSKLRSISQECF